MSQFESKLSWGLLMFPNMLSELPDILSCLDKGEPVYIDKISESSLRSFLKEIIQDIYDLSKNAPTSNSTSSTKPTSTSSIIKSYCQQVGITKKANNLSNSEALAYRSGMPRLLHLLTELPELKTEIVVFLDNLIEQERVDLSGIEDSNVREGLGTLLTSLGFKCNDDIDINDDDVGGEEVYSFPNDESKHEILKECLEHLKHVFIVASRYKPLGSIESETNAKQKAGQENDTKSEGSDELSDEINDKDRKKLRKEEKKKAKKDKKAKKKEKKKQHYESSSSSSHHKRDKSKGERDKTSESESDGSGSKGSDIESDGDYAVSKTAKNNTAIIKSNTVQVIGPSVPSGYANALNNNNAVHGRREEEEDEEDIGPLPYTSSTSYPSSSSSSVYAALMDNDDTNESSSVAKKSSHTTTAIAPLGGYIEPSGSHAVSLTGEGAFNAGEQCQREEWMTDVGENRILTGAFGATRTFQSGKLAKKAAAEYLAVKERHDAVARASASTSSASSDTTNAKAAAAQEEEIRGPSLMQLHLQQKTAIEAQVQASLGGKDKRRPFDREKDVLQHKKMDRRQVADLAENAKELSSRFDRGSFQRGI